MGSKDKTVSFRVGEDQFEDLKRVSDSLEPSLSQIFRDFVTEFNEHEGRVKAVPKHQTPNSSSDGFPMKVEVSKSMVREHERLELEAEHLRDELREYRSYASNLEQQVEEAEREHEELIVLEDFDSVSDFRVSTD